MIFSQKEPPIVFLFFTPKMFTSIKNQLKAYDINVNKYVCYIKSMLIPFFNYLKEGMDQNFLHCKTG